MKMKWCVIGAAGIADRRTIPALVADEENQLCAVMDKVEEAAKAVGEKYGVPYYTDAEQMLKAIMQDEKDVQEKVKKAMQEVQPRRFEKDW